MAEFTRVVTGPGAPVTGTPTPNVAPPAPAKPPEPSKPDEAAPAAVAPSPAAAPPPVPQATADDLQQRSVALSRERQRLLQEKRSLQARDLEIAKLQADIKRQQEDMVRQREELAAENRRRDEAKRDPLAWLKYGGHSYEEAAKQVLNGGQPGSDLEIARLTEQVQAQQQAIEGWRKQYQEDQERSRKEIEEREKQRVEQEQKAALENFQRNCIDYVNQNGDKYKLITLFGRQAEVPALVDLYYQQSYNQDKVVAEAQGRDPVGRVLSHAEAAKMVEDYYVQKVKEAGGVLSLAPTGTQTLAAQPGATGTTPVPASGAATLTNGLTAPSAPGRTGGLLSEAERMERARAAWDAARAKAPVGK